jgi:hypothetical protein
VNEIRRNIERLVEHGEQSVTLTLENFKPGVRNQLHGLFQEVETGEWVAVAAQKEGRAANRGQMLGAQLVREARAVERIRKKDETTEVRLYRGHARNPSAE